MSNKCISIRLSAQVLVLLFGLFASLATAGQQRLQFNHFTVEDGLSSASALSIAQDEKGFLWIGTMDGLNRYDGKRVKIYTDFYSKNPIGPNVQIKALLADKKNHLWIGTNHGLFLYNSQTDSFTVINHDNPDKESISHNQVNSLFMDSGGGIWIGTNAGLHKVIQKQQRFDLLPVSLGDNDHHPGGNNVQTVFESAAGTMMAGTEDGIVIFSKQKNAGGKPAYRYALPGVIVTSIAEDKRGNFWVGTNGAGLLKMDSNLNKLKHYQQNVNKSGLLSNIIRKLHTDQMGRIWAGTFKGLNIFYPETEQVDSYVHNPNDDRSLNFNSIYNIYEDRQGNIWIATYFGGLNNVEALTTPFTVYQNAESETGISSNIISGIVDDEHNNLWIGTEAEGLNYFDRNSQLFIRYKNGETKNAAISSNLVKALLRDKDNHIWIGMHRGGVNVIDAAGRKLKEFGLRNKDRYTINSENVSGLMQDNEKRIWIGTELNGINIYDFKTDKTEKFETVYPGTKLSSNSITFLFRDTEENIWIGTRRGLNMLQAREKGVKIFSQTNYPDQLPLDYINCITEDRQKRIWIGSHSGLSYYDPVKKTLGTYTVKDGLGGNKVVGIIADRHDNLWISTNNGLSRLDSTRTHFATFNVYDGLPGNAFNYNSFFKDKKGTQFFGGYNGLVEFDPEKVKMNRTAPKITLTGLSINGHAVHTRDPSGILSNDIAETNELTLKYNQNVLTIDYAVMNFIKPAKNKSAYMIEGYDMDWIYTDAHSASFTNLPAGSYSLLIKAANNDAVWNDKPHVLTITVLPPPWKSWWAYTLYGVFGGLLILWAIYFFASRAALRRKIQYEKMVNAKQEELHRMKMDFFTHISHEIRTPLTLIMGPVEMLLRILPAGSQGQKLLLTVKSNAERLLKLTTDLLDFRKADSGYTQLTIRAADIVAFTRSVYDKFTGAAAKKSIEHSFDCKEESIEVYFDPHHLEIVLSNLCSNAIKFTPDKGRIWVHIARKNNETVEITVGDNGIGIPKESEDKIFSNYYQANAGGIKNLGSGIGLAFSKSLVELHKGKLNFQSDINPETGRQETRFIVTLQLGKDHFTGNHLITN